MKSGIYAIVNLIDGKLYVGSAVYFARRWSEHRTRLRDGVHHNQILQRAWDKYGAENFEFKVLEYVENITKLVEIETKWINVTKCLDRDFGYNFCKEGANNLGVKRSKETGLKISNALKGRNLSEEQKLKISKSLKGIKFSPTRKTNKGKPWSQARRLAQKKVILNPDRRTNKGQPWSEARRKSQKQTPIILVKSPIFIQI